jgi:hypothetical protein
MPFPLAHPAAVLPLRRYCPRLLNLPALVIGSVIPDLGYLGGGLGLDEISHRPLFGTLVFSLPAGLVLLAAFYGLRLPVVKRLPPHLRERLLPLCHRPRGLGFGIVLSLLIGIATHLVWDSFTHKNTWLFEHLSILQFPLAHLGRHELRVCHLLWYISSFGGIACLGWAYQHWLETSGPGVSLATHKARLRNVLLLALLVLPIEALHHLLRTPFTDYLVGALTLALVAGAALNLGCAER